jgi:hypothetical protein
MRLPEARQIIQDLLAELSLLVLQQLQFSAQYIHWIPVTLQVRGVHNCIPHDFVAYFMVDWEPKHGFRNKVIAPSTVNSLISHLAMEIDKFGKAHFWDPATGGGKTAVSRKFSRPHLLYLSAAV